MNKARFWLIAALCIVAGPAAAANIIENPGFESAGTGWDSRRFTFSVYESWAHSGSGEARTGCMGAQCLSDYGQGAYLRQLLPTVAGEQYDIGFWVRSYSGVGEYTLFWDGALIDDKIVANGPMLYEAYNNLTASGAATTLEIHGRNDAAMISFDDIVVMPSGPPVTQSSSMAGMVPEPLGFMMLAAGLALAAYRLRRRR